MLSLTSFLVHHVLLSTVVSDAVDIEVRTMPLTKRWLTSPKECIPFLRIFHDWLLILIHTKKKFGYFEQRNKHKYAPTDHH